MLAIILMFAVGGFSFGELIGALILFCCAYSYNYCLSILYMFIMMQKVVQYFSAIGLVIQNGRFGSCYGGSPPRCGFVITMMMIFLLFSVGAVYVTFLAYRIFKAQ